MVAGVAAFNVSIAADARCADAACLSESARQLEVAARDASAQLRDLIPKASNPCLKDAARDYRTAFDAWVEASRAWQEGDDATGQAEVQVAQEQLGEGDARLAACMGAGTTP